MAYRHMSVEGVDFRYREMHLFADQRNENRRADIAHDKIFLVLVAILPLDAILFYNLYSIRVDKEREVHAEAFRIGQMAALEMQPAPNFLKRVSFHMVP
ncbi:hypothetical protein [Rhizobium leguminosarum]